MLTEWLSPIAVSVPHNGHILKKVGVRPLRLPLVGIVSTLGLPVLERNSEKRRTGWRHQLQQSLALHPGKIAASLGRQR